MSRDILCDLSVADVHTPSAAKGSQSSSPSVLEHWDRSIREADLSISADKRASLPESDFALPESRRYPLDTAARTRNAAARLVQMKRRGKVTQAQYDEARKRIGAAAKRYGIESEFEATDAAPKRVMPKPRGKAIHIRADLAPGGALHVRHMSDHEGQQVVVLSDGSIGMRDVRRIVQGEEVDPGAAGVHLMGPSKYEDGSPVKLVWTKLAEVGAWKGHPAGAFQMTPTTFSEVVRNFDRRGLPVPFDMEHASEAEPTEGSIPTTGAPSQAWAHKLDNRGAEGLWGLVEYLNYARTAIKAGNFAFVSPAIRFDSKDTVTGQKIGARLTSVALTNRPFLTGLGQLRAATDAAAPAAASVDLRDAAATRLFGDRLPASARPRSVAMSSSGGTLVHSPHEYMPSIKRALRVPELTSATDCSDHLDRLRDCCMSSGFTGMHEGTDLGGYTQPLRDLVGATPGMTWEEVFDAVQDLIDAAIDEHEAEFHPGQAAMRDAPASGAAAPTTEEGSMSTTDTAAAANAVALTEATNKVSALETEKSTLTLKLSEATTKAGRVDALEATVATVSGILKLRDDGKGGKETIEQAAQRLADENARLLTEQEKRDEADLKADVEVAFLTHRDKMGLTDASKAHMMRLAKADREAFNGMYPPISPEKRHLLSTVVQPEARQKSPQAESFTACVRRLMSENPHLSYADAQDEASRLLKG